VSPIGISAQVAPEKAIILAAPFETEVSDFTAQEIAAHFAEIKNLNLRRTCIWRFNYRRFFVGKLCENASCRS
jgi:hypothetical protein